MADRRSPRTPPRAADPVARSEQYAECATTGGMPPECCRAPWRPGSRPERSERGRSGRPTRPAILDEDRLAHIEGYYSD